MTEWVAFCHPSRMSLDPVASNPEHYKVVFENERVRVLEYTDQPGDQTTPHQHPDSVMYTLSSFRRRLVSGETSREVELHAGSAGWLPAQEHHGENIGTTPTHVVFVELKEPAPGAERPPAAGSGLGPESS
jgi:quercetin dioxygenase-like cupin family protein